MSAVEQVFLDTNVLVYAHDRMEAQKGPAAVSLLTRIVALGRPIVSVQVLSEFFWSATRKIPLPLTVDEAIAEVTRMNNHMNVVSTTWAILAEALQAIKSHSMPLWDAQIFAAARLHGATVVLSEYFQHRRVVNGITFLNPFAPDFDLDAALAA
jgi:predicted nucleic acid-binding protein